MYKRYLLIILTNFALALFQVSFFPELFGPGFVLNLVFAFAFAFLIVGRREDAFFSAFTGGLLIDLLGLHTVGLSPFIFTLFIFLAGLVKSYVLNNFFSHLILFIGAGILYLVALNYPEKAPIVPVLWSTALSFAVSYIFSILHKSALHERKFI